MSTSPPAPLRPKRADALRNRARVIAAADEVFSERGTEAGIPEIALRAGVGKGTVYRSYPTKDHLVAAVVIERLRWVERKATEAAQEEDAWEGFRALLRSLAEAQRSDLALIEAVTVAGPLSDVEAARVRAQRALRALMGRAKEQGGMRADARPEDVRILFGGAARVLSADPAAGAAAWRRCADLTAAALSAGAED
jgi:AcrR family transcriptional regulator